jgi:hypothetical protein
MITRKTLIFSLAVAGLLAVLALSLPKRGGVLLATNRGQNGSGSCCPLMGGGPTAAPTEAAGKACPVTRPADDRAVNARCPIMGSAIDPAKVPANLTRPFKGRKVGFCCGGCPAAWDQLSEDQKQAALDKALAEK